MAEVVEHTCEYGYPEPCGVPARWSCYNRKTPFISHACDEHVRSMATVVVPKGKFPDESITLHYDYAL